MFERLHRHKSPSIASGTSQLFSDETFYPAFARDLNRCSFQAYIESPFITNRRVANLLPIFQILISKGIHIVVNTRDPHEHELYMMREGDSLRWASIPKR